MRVFDGGDSVRESRSGRDGDDAHAAAEPRDGVGGEHGVDFVTRVDDANAEILAGDQNWRDVTADESEDVTHFGSVEDLD